MTKAKDKSLSLNSLSDSGSKQNRKRVGRGIGSGTGKTAGRGHKGQKSRSGGSIPRWFEGGQMPLQQRLPKFGFSSRVNNFSTDLNLKAVDGLKEVDLQILKDNKLINKKIKKVKIYGNHKLSKPIKISGISLSKGAEKSVIDAGGVVEN
jgi:large subunit ribosomal protein L15